MNKAGNLESHMCLLNDQEETIDVVSLHKFKSERVYKAGRIVNIHSATLKEIEKHQALILKNNRGLMKDIEKRKIIVLRLHQNGMYFGQRMQ